MNEIWKTYTENTEKRKGYRYQKIEVSDLGNVKADGKQIDFSKRKPNRYYTIKGLYVHRMVAELFIPNPENKPFVDHINTNSHDNRAVNLRWVTPKENTNNYLTLNKMTKINKSTYRRNQQAKYRLNKKLMTDGIDRIFVEPEYWGEFLDIGFWFACEKHHKLLY